MNNVAVPLKCSGNYLFQQIKKTMKFVRTLCAAFMVTVVVSKPVSSSAVLKPSQKIYDKCS